jgi:uncharacterized membrane protein YccC
MNRTPAWKAWIAAELRGLATVQRSDRLWQMPLAGSLAIGLPLLAGAWQGDLHNAMVASIGGLVFLYVPNTPMSHRMVALMSCAFAMTTCFALGLLIALAPAGATLVITAVAALVTMLCRFYNLGPPGSLFFVMAAMVALALPPDAQALPTRVGFMALGSALACLIAFVYSLHAIRLRPPGPVVPPPAPTFDHVVFDAVVIGLFVGLSLALAQALRLDKAYWVAVSCLAVIQGQTLRAVWTKQLHRVIGTTLGLGLAAALFQIPLDAWRLCALLMVLQFVIEVTVVRHYAFAVIFITPLTLLLAEAPTLGHTPIGPLIHARFLDTLLGCAVGLAGGWCLHSPRFRARLGGWLRALVPRRFDAPGGG